MFQYKKDYLALSFHKNLWISRDLALITHGTTTSVNPSIVILRVLAKNTVAGGNLFSAHKKVVYIHSNESWQSQHSS